jgi:hypothetical protein
LAGNRSEGLLARAHPLEQAERISRSMVEMRVVDGALLLDTDPAWAGAINTVLVTKGMRVSELCPILKSKVERPTPRDHSVPHGIEAYDRTATGLIRALTQRTHDRLRHTENPNQARSPTHQDGLQRAAANS